MGKDIEQKLVDLRRWNLYLSDEMQWKLSGISEALFLSPEFIPYLFTAIFKHIVSNRTHSSIPVNIKTTTLVDFIKEEIPVISGPCLQIVLREGMLCVGGAGKTALTG